MDNKGITERSQRSEKAIEKYLVSQVRKMGGLALKYTNSNEAGYPDRIVVTNGSTFWVELKSKGEKPRPLQEHCIEKLRSLGQRVYVADSREMVDLILEKEHAVQSTPLSE